MANQDPIAEPDLLEMSKVDANLVGNVLDNDVDPDGDVLSVVNSGTAITLYGILVLAADGSFTYTLDQTHPDVVNLGPDESLTDFFDYEVSDGRGGTASGLFFVLING